jgi:hypothetical protein
MYFTQRLIHGFLFRPIAQYVEKAPTATPARKMTARNMSIHAWSGSIALSPSAISFPMWPFAYFGQPSAGFFFDRDFFIRSFQFPLRHSRGAVVLGSEKFEKESIDRHCRGTR